MSFSAFCPFLRKSTLTLLILGSMSCFHAQASDDSEDSDLPTNYENTHHFEDINPTSLSLQTLEKKQWTGTQKVGFYFPLTLGFTLQTFSQFFYALSAHSDQSLEICATNYGARSGRCFSNNVADLFAVFSAIPYTFAFVYFCYLSYVYGNSLGFKCCRTGKSD